MLAQLGCLPGTCTNQRSPYCLFLWVGNKSNTCHIRASCARALRKRHLSVRVNEADSPGHQPPSVWHVLRVSFPIQKNLTTKKAISQMWGVGFSENRSAFVNGKGPLPMTQINSKKKKNTYAQHMSQLKKADREQETNLEGGKRRKPSLG